VVTSLWSKSVRKDIVDDVILGKHTMIGAIVVLVPEKVERCHFLLVLIGSLSKSFGERQKIMGSSVIVNS
jgi:hypothetical protein